MKCKICNEDLYKELDFRTIFRRRYAVHYSCLDKLKTTVESITFPITNRLIEYHYIYEVETKLDMIVVEQLTFHHILKDCEYKLDYWGSIKEFLKLDDDSQYLFWSLQNEVVVFGSIVQEFN